MTNVPKNGVLPCTMGRREISENISGRLRLRQKDVRQVLDEMLEELSDAFVSGDDVKIPNFGKFSLMQKSERIGRNPKTKETAVVSARCVISFKPAKALTLSTINTNRQRSRSNCVL